MKELTPQENLCFRIGAVLILFGAAIFIVTPMIGMCLYGVGTVLFTLMQVRAEYMGRNITIIRLRRQQLLGCCCFVVALVMMSMQVHGWGPFRRQEWVIALTIACVLELYTSFRIPKELEAES